MKIKTFARLIIFSVLISGFCFTANAQTDFEEWKRQRQQQMQEFKAEREKQLEQLAATYEEYVKAQDEAFTDYLTERWRQFEVFQGIAPPAEPKPDSIPEYPDSDRRDPPRPLPNVNLVPQIRPVEPAKPVLPRVVKKEPEAFPVNVAEMDFYGVPLGFEYDKLMVRRLGPSVSEASISAYFEELSNANYNTFLTQLYNHKDLMNLNDWGYYKMIRKAADQIAGNDQNTARLLTWFLLVRSGYLAKAAFADDEVFVLLPVKNQVYARNFFTFNNMRYYMMEGEADRIFTYEQDFPEARRIFDLNIYNTLVLGEDITDVDLSFAYQGEQFKVPVSYNSNVIGFYKDYPQADVRVYFDAAVSHDLKLSLIENFAPLIAGKTEPEAVNLLLRFVQTAFDYQTDDEQFGYEKFFFADELFYYPYSDCEDRSVLFSYLVKSLLGLDVVGLQFPGHIATAVAFNEPVNGDYVMHEGRKFIVADPTYINAPVGLTMPDFADQQADIILIENIYGNARQSKMIWEELMAAGAGRGDNRSDIIINPDGKALVTGYFTASFSYGDIAETGTDAPVMFTMMLDESNRPLWFNRSTGSGKAVSYAVTSGSDGNFYVSGTFSGEMRIDRHRIESVANDIFVAGVNERGETLWLEKAGLDSVNQDNFLTFVSRFSADGKPLGNSFYFNNSNFDNFGITHGDNNELIVAGAFNNNTGMNRMDASFDTSGEFSVIEVLKDENDRLLREDYERTIAGLFAAVNLINSTNISIPGVEVQKVLDRYNPGFKKNSPNIYQTIGSILFIKSNDGIVTLQTDSRKGISIDMMKLDNDAKIKIVMLESGDARLDILSGVRVGKALWWYDLNYIHLYKLNGNMLFDYDTDNSQQVINLRTDILY